MKKIFTILVVFINGILISNAQVSGKFESVKKTVLNEYTQYFTGVELTENKQLKLFAVTNYQNLAVDEKRKILYKIATVWNESYIIVQYEIYSELWSWKTETNTLLMLDKWKENITSASDLNQSLILNSPWFFYAGGMLGGDNQKNFNFSLNVRVGCFLLRDRIDFATTFSTGFSENIDINNSKISYNSLGLMGRLHFPLKEYNISPNIGLEFTVSSSGSSPSATAAALVLGIRWYVGIGSLDIGFKFGSEFSTMAGYTFVPPFKNNK